MKKLKKKTKTFLLHNDNDGGYGFFNLTFYDMTYDDTLFGGHIPAIAIRLLH